MRPVVELMDEDDCVHPFKECVAFAIRGSQEVNGITGFMIHFKCKRCGHEMTMLSQGHVATPQEAETFKGNPPPGYG